MSSRRRKAAIAAARAALQEPLPEESGMVGVCAGCAGDVPPGVVYCDDCLEEEWRAEQGITREPTGPQLVSLQRKKRAQEHHDQRMVHLRSARRQSVQVLDGLETANEAPEWRWETMVAAHDIDGSGAPKLKDSFAEEMDLTATQRRSARYWGAYRLMALEWPAQAVAYYALFHREGGATSDQPTEESVAARLGITLTLLRSRVWRAHKRMREECDGVLPARVQRYGEERERRISRQNRDRVAAHWQKIQTAALATHQ